MHSILTIMAIESMAPDVRTVAEVNNPRHVEHFRRARGRRDPRDVDGSRRGCSPGPRCTRA